MIRRLLTLGATAATVASGVVVVRASIREAYAYGMWDGVVGCSDELTKAWAEGYLAAIKHLAEGEATANPYLQSTEGGV